MLSAGKRWLVHASQPHLLIHALFSVPSVLIYNTREAPLFVTWWPKWPEPAEDTSGASGCGGRSRELASRSLPLDTCFDEASVSTS